MLIPILNIYWLYLSKKSEDDKKDKTDNVLYVYNWGDYIDEDLLKKFEDETGIKVKYDIYDTNEIMYSKD